MKTQKSRPTIAYLARSIHTTTSMTIWLGAVDEARKQNVNLICVVGEKLGTGAGSILYDLITENTVDAVMSWASSDQDETVRFYDRYQSIPLVTLTLPVRDRPVVVIDSYQGIREIMTHLIEEHGYQRIAFIRGPEHHVYARERYQGYLDALEAYGLPRKPNLVTPPLGWGFFSGEQAIQVLFEQRHLQAPKDIEAIVATNDRLAIGALQVLQRKGFRIPEDVAVTGFNDSIEARCTTPTVTSAAMPFYTQGQRAVELTMAMLQGNDVPERVTLPATIVIHQSCGCIEPTISQAKLMLSPSPGTLSPGSSHFEAAFAQQRPVLLQAIVEYSLPIEPHWIESLIDAFVAEIAGDSDNRFLSIFNMILERVRHTESNILLWQNVISSLRQHVLTCLDSPALLVQAENLCGQARIMIGEAAHRKEIYQQWQTVLQAETLREINQLLMTTFHVEGVVEALNDGLARIKIPGCYLALYENPRPYTYPQRAPEWSRLILAYHESQRIELEAGGRRFPSHQLLPEGILSQDKPYTLVVEPLYFREEQIGFIMFEVGPRDGVIYETLRLDVSSTLKGALLMQQIQEHSAQLAREQYIIDTFMATVPDRIYFKDLQGRITRANAAHAAWLGLRDSAEEIGKTDFDFFPEEEAWLRYEQEQKIISTGESFVNQEEQRSLPEGERVNWSLATKMPLRDERGEIIGTFGISKDITDLKLAQKQLIQAEKMAALGELVAGVTHEINTPLGVGVTAASHLEANTREIEQLFSNNSITRSALEKYLRVARETSEIILRNLQRASDHIKGFKQVAVDQTHEERRRFTLKPYLEDVLKSLHPKIKSSGHRVTLICPPDLELYSYPGAFSQIISNFVMNSLIHGFEQMSHGEIQIELTEEEDHLVLRYQDNGKGMDQETQDRIFDPFFTTKRGQGGSGLGMHIVYNLVTQQLAGQITCESSPNNGVVFVLRIPIGLAQPGST